jgi:hypothetical protein
VLTGDHGMTSWNQSLLPAVLTQLTEAGFTPEIVTPGQGPAAPCDVVIVPNSRTPDMVSSIMQGRVGS